MRREREMVCAQLDQIYFQFLIKNKYHIANFNIESPLKTKSYNNNEPPMIFYHESAQRVNL